MRICLVGCGAMGSALLKGWLAKLDSLESVRVVTPHESSVAPFLGDPRVSWAPSDGPFGLPPMDVYVLAVKPQVIPDLVFTYEPIIQNHLLLSIAAGLDMGFYNSHFPKAPVIRAMPNTPAQVFEGMTVMVGNERVTPEHRQIAEDLMACVGEYAWVSDDHLMDLVTAISGCGPAYYYAICETIANLAVEKGLPRPMAEVMARQTLIGAAAYLKASGKDPEILRHEVTSKGGLTESALEVLLGAQGLHTLFDRAIDNALLRGIHLRGEKP